MTYFDESFITYRLKIKLYHWEESLGGGTL